MASEIFDATGKRLRILEPKEIQDIFDLPLFSEADQKYFFSLTLSEHLLVDRQKLPKNRLLMILQLGYFKAKQRFFDFTWNDVLSDTDYISNQYLQGFDLNLSDSPDYRTRHNQQNQILSEHKYTRFPQSMRKTTQDKLIELVRGTTQPAQLARHMLKMLHAERVMIPSYRVFQDIISSALSCERKRIRSVFSKSLPEDLSKQMVVWLNEDRSGETALAFLIQEPKNFKYTQVKREIENKAILTPWYSKLAAVLKGLDISCENIIYYASLLPFYTVSQLVKQNQQNQFLILICFLYLRYQKINDYLIDALRVGVNGLQQDAKAQAKEKLLEYKISIENQFDQVGQILNLFTDDEINDNELFGDIRSLAFDCLSAKELAAVVDYINQKVPSSKNFEWEALVKLYNSQKPLLRAILRTLDFSYQSHESLAKAVAFFNSVKRISNVKSNQWPIQWIPAGQKQFIINEDGVVDAARWEILLFMRLKARISSYSIWVNDSQEYRKLEDELISVDALKDKDELIDKYQVAILKNTAETHLANLEEELEPLYTQVNEAINSGQNEFFKTYKKKGETHWSLDYEAKDQDENESLLRQLKSISIFEVMHYANNACEWDKAFFHKRAVYRKKSLETGNLFAAILATGTALGLEKMSKISDLAYSDIESASRKYVRLETLSAANEIISDATANLSFFKHFDIDGVIHSSSDGQHHETQFDTIKSYHLPKYFGLKKGIVIYALLANHVPINSEIIGTHDHESHFVFDLIYNNTTQIRPKIHSTDSHGVNSLNFSLLHFFGYQFAPRYKNIRRRTNRLVGFKKVSEYPDEYLIKPSRKTRGSNIVKHWDTVSRIILSLGSRTTRQSTIVRKLSALPDNHSLKSALLEYNMILESIHMLKYIHDFGFRQNIQASLNRGEAYHQLQRDLSFANRGRPKSKKTDEQAIWSECKRLLANCIVYYNTSVLSELLDKHAHYSGIRDQLEGISPVCWSHINLYGYYIFKALRDKDLDVSVIAQPVFDFWESSQGV